MAPNMANQPRLVVTIQPPGVHLDPPAPMAFPNTEGLPPGSILDFFSFDHDQGQFVSIGTVQVSADGLVVQSDPGVGIVKGGWHTPPPPPAPKRGNAATFTVTLDDVDPVLMEKNASGSGLMEETFMVTTKGEPSGGDRMYTFSVVDPFGGPTKVEFIEEVTPCIGQAVCKARFKGINPGKTNIKVVYGEVDETDGGQAQAETEVVVGAEVDIDVAAFIPFTFVPDALLIDVGNELVSVLFGGDTRTAPDPG